MTVPVTRPTGSATETGWLEDIGPCAGNELLGTVMGMRSRLTSSTTTRGLVACIALSAALVACGSDDDTVEVPEGGTGSAYNDAIRASESHDEIVFPEGGDMVVAVDCDPESGGTLVTVVAEGLAPGVYVGMFDPSTGVDLTLDVSSGGQSVGEAQMTLEEDDYTVTFADIEDAEFNLRGCPS